MHNLRHLRSSLATKRMTQLSLKKWQNWSEKLIYLMKEVSFRISQKQWLMGQKTLSSGTKMKVMCPHT